jgi:shikimate kinase
MKKTNIVLTGMPGAGKSTIGVIAAKALGFSFCDTDLLLQKQEGGSLQSMIDTQGITRFLEKEKQVVLSLSLAYHVIATGGSVVYHHESMDHLKTGGIVVYLDVPYRELKKRITNMKTRGIAMEQNRSFRDIYDQRLPLYRKSADVTVFCKRKHIEDIVREIVLIWEYENK